MLKVVFLFNHNLTHQIFHAAPYAFELSKKYPDVEVAIACSSRQMMSFVKRLEPLYPEHKCHFKMLSMSCFSVVRLLGVFRKRVKYSRLILKDNLDFFRGFDALVAPERQCVRLRTHLGLENLTFVYTGHGAGDREGSFNNRSEAFDLTLLAGPKYIDKLNEIGYFKERKYAVVGYPKFEVVRRLNSSQNKLFKNNNPVVIYNPHFDQHVSSWGKMGIEVLEFFENNPNWNLIFAPHVGLFKRSKRNNAFLPKKYNHIPNIHIDTGSDACVDMTYILAADIYLGDASSQVYEFLLEKRPCIFLNAHNVDWQQNPYHSHWGFGQVVNDVNLELGTALEQAFTTHQQFLQKQQDAFDYTFYNDPESTAAERGAKAIVDFLSVVSE